MASTRNARRRAAHDALNAVVLVVLAFVGLCGCAPEGKPPMSVPASAFKDPMSRAFVEAVAADDVDGAMLRARAVPGGVNVQGEAGETALLVAVARLNKPMVSALLKAGASPDGGLDRAPLAMAVQAKDPWFATTLLQAGGSPNATSGGESPLVRAILVNRSGMVELLLDAGAFVDAPDSLGATPSMTAAKIDDFAAVAHLLRRGASPYAADDRGLSLAYLTAESALSSRHPQGQARDAVASRLQAAGVPWPPPSPPELLALKAAGRWPPSAD